MKQRLFVCLLLFTLFSAHFLQAAETKPNKMTPGPDIIQKKVVIIIMKQRLFVCLLLFTLFSAHFLQAAETKPNKMTLGPDIIQKKWTGDLDGMIKRRVVRVLTVYSKTFYFLDKDTQRGIVYDT